MPELLRFSQLDGTEFSAPKGFFKDHGTPPLVVNDVISISVLRPSESAALHIPLSSRILNELM
jgi:hypothetical protein